VIEVLRRSVEFALRPAVGVHDRPDQAAPGPPGGVQGIDDQLGAHVVSDGVAGQPSGVQVDDGGQVEETTVTDG
jgi:hypothetical protein